MKDQSRPLRVVQLSDCHMAADPRADYRGQNADLNLQAVIENAVALKPEVVLLTGDVSEDASRESYRRVADMLSRIPAPLLSLPGNHDDPGTMREFFTRGPWEGPLVTARGAWRIVMLDSTRPGEVSGRLSDSTMDWLEEELEAHPGAHHLLALHHQPMEVGAPWIDRYRLQSPARFVDRISRTDSVRCVLWGHVHHDYRAESGGTYWFGAPSTVANSLPGTEKFTIDPNGPSCRWLELENDGRLTTGVIGVLG